MFTNVNQWTYIKLKCICFKLNYNLIEILRIKNRIMS